MEESHLPTCIYSHLLGIQVQHGTVTSYPQLFLEDCGKFVTTDLKKTLRDNSCIQYKRNCVGILHKVIEAGARTLAIVKRLRLKEKLCTDMTTDAKLYFKVCLPRYKEYILKF